MKNFKLLSSSLAAVMLATSAIAPSVAQAQVEANVAIQSDYVWRGVTQNGEDPSIQGGFDYASGTGFYVGIWGASVDFGGDESTEIDLYGGWGTEFDNGIGIDLGIIEYTYHGGASASGDFTEYYVGLSYAGFGVTYYAGDEFDDNIEVSYGYDFDSGISLAGTYGDYDSYSYFTVGASIEVADIGLDLSFWDTDVEEFNDPLGLGDSRVVLTVSKSF